MRVLHIIPTLGTGGAEKLLVDIVEVMMKQGIDCEVAVLSLANNKFGTKFHQLGIKLHYSHIKKVYDIRNILFIKSIFQQGDYDLIHTHLFAAQLFTPISQLFLKNKIKMVTTEHSTNNRRRDNKLFYLLDHWMYKKYERIIAITDGTKEALNQYLKYTAEKTLVIHNGINLAEYELSATLDRKEISMDIHSNEIIVLMVAAARSQKDHETLIRASKLLSDQYRVVFVGDGERFPDLEQYTMKYGKENTLFLGFRDDVPSIMKAADIFVLSTKWEGFGLVVVEAASAGLPVIASNVEGLREIVEDINGMLFNPGDEYDLAKKIMEIGSGDVRVYYNLEKYNIFNTVMQYLELYKNVINKD